MPPRRGPSLGGRVGQLVPLVVLTGYVAYVLTDRFEDHNSRRKEMDKKNEVKKVAAAEAAKVKALGK
jgi:hypothetical protein